MNIVPLEQVTHLGGKGYFWVVANLCPVCRKGFDHELALAISLPHACLLHKECVHLFNEHQHWPHPVPFHTYITGNPQTFLKPNQ